MKVSKEKKVGGRRKEVGGRRKEFDCSYVSMYIWGM